MLKEEELAVRDTGRPCPEAPVHPEVRSLGFDRVLVFLPVHAVGGIGQHVVEALARMGVLRERVAEGDLLGVVACHEHVRFADAERLAVELLAEELDADRVVEAFQRFFGQRQHTARPARRVIDLADDAAPCELFIVIGDEKIDDEADHLAGGEVFPCGLVRDF